MSNLKAYSNTRQVPLQGYDKVDPIGTPNQGSSLDVLQLGKNIADLTEKIAALSVTGRSPMIRANVEGPSSIPIGGTGDFHFLLGQKRVPALKWMISTCQNSLSIQSNGVLNVGAGGAASATGSVTDPSAGAVIAAIAASTTPAGWYNVTATIGYGATAGTVASNFKIFWNGNASSLIPTTIPLTANTYTTYNLGTVYLNGLNSFQVTAVATDSAGVYNATLTATPVGAEGNLPGVTYNIDLPAVAGGMPISSGTLYETSIRSISLYSSYATLTVNDVLGVNGPTLTSQTGASVTIVGWTDPQFNNWSGSI